MAEPLEPEETLEGASADGSPTDGKGLRQKLEAALERIGELEAETGTTVESLTAQIEATEYEKLGLDPQHGIGKAIKVTYEGDPSGIAEFAAEEFGYTGPQNPLVATIASGYAKLDAVATSAGSIVPPTESDRLARAEAKHDTDTSMAIKADHLGRLIQGKQ